ncbi:outer membrane transport energization protein ExbD [Fibrobacter sp. UWB15]|uniref:ExbD/TolR family protein n=1 Tax=unclassified Fibrobacter TaxID=2634177 RepID=UPI00091B76EB|nr:MULTISPECIES: biopolymer transporter ExbD [unclassified Fibrobacter]PWJ65030.1 outer membrane transport energization protein ExbD [Fibrobacter sp. UWB6]SHG10960.1 outer membrane transport energization protein ExbD [Fibrobacter sp. UWB8]SHK32309.1 outer membrane transport energization protein ExbD [Fibrobacter sp. UWT2]SMG30356.1 outer membrane transport energization protein ExbD [Fibrobacter sp. UWB15]
MKRSRGKELKQEMNLTNMIDIVFAILIVFIISAPLMSQGVKVDLPKAEAPTMEQEKLLKVSITKNEELYIADMMVDFASFNNVFKSLWNGEMAVVINADESVNYGLVMKVVTQVQKLGVTKLGFLTMNPKERPGKK